MHLLPKIIAFIFPTTLPGVALKNMIIKGYLCHESILIGFFVPIAWISFCIFGLIFVLKKNKFFNQK